MDEAQRIQVLRQKYPNEISIGFTGTREGMTTSQWDSVSRIFTAFSDYKNREHHNGDCLGADEQAYATANLNGYRIIGHPCNLTKWRAFNEYYHTEPIAPPLVRNRVIVRRSDLMVAAPKEYDEQFRGSGTWATIRYARRMNKPLFICWSDGTVQT